MAESFNPYRDWLGLADGRRPATHYGWFGLKPLEDDAAEIRRGMARLATRLRGMKPGEHVGQWREMIRDLSVARDCLTDAAAKAAYDAQLRALGAATPRNVPPPPLPPQAKGAAPGAAVVPPEPPPPPPAPAASWMPDEPALGSFASRPTARRTHARTATGSQWVVRLLVLVFVGLSGLIGYVVYQRYQQGLTDSQARQAKPEKVEKKVEAPAQPTAAELAKAAAAERAQKKARLEKNLADWVAALGRRDLGAAKSLAAEARANAQADDEQANIARYEKLTADVRDFWRTTRDRVRQFEPGKELTLGKTRLRVVEAQGTQFAIQYGNKIFHCTLETVPAWLVIALADCNAPGDEAAKEAYGAFLAVDPEGDRARARTLWSEAAKAGAKTEDLLSLLDTLPPPGQ